MRSLGVVELQSLQPEAAFEVVAARLFLRQIKAATRATTLSRLSALEASGRWNGEAQSWARGFMH